MPYCDACERNFDSQTALHDHRRNSAEHNRPCDTCKEVFDNESDLQRHIEEEHYRRCELCNRIFRSDKNRNAHLRSSTHHLQDITCPVDDCEQDFTSRSAWVLHLEEGGCMDSPRQMDRLKVNRAIHRLDKDDNLITLSSNHGRPRIRRLVATESSSQDGKSYNCRLCDGRFDSLYRLNSHLASPHHALKDYKCPEGSCEAKFPSLDALLQHIESDSCEANFGQIEDLYKRFEDWALLFDI